MEIEEGKFYHLHEDERETLVRIKAISWGCRDAGDQSTGWENWASAFVLADNVGIGLTRSENLNRSSITRSR